MKNNFCVLIPAYKPGECLIDLVKEIRLKLGCQCVVVDDGSGNEYKKIFDELRLISGCHVIGYEKNGGKGHALKTGFKFCMEKYSGDKSFEGVVTADADGQHLIKDIFQVGKELSENPDSLIMGVRSFGKNVPLRSKLGNNITIFVYRIASGIKISDTQTGLRGIPAKYLEQMISLEGERYEYEMNMLLKLKDMGLGVREVTIETVYIDDNSSSHFNTIKDSAKIYGLIFRKAYIFKYILSSLAAFIVDYIVYVMLFSTGLMTSKNATIPARVVSSIFNFAVNKKFVFNSNKGTRSYFTQGAGYFLLVIFNLFVIVRPVNMLLVSLGISEYISQPIANVIQFIISYVVQKLIIFRIKKK